MKQITSTSNHLVDDHYVPRHFKFDNEVSRFDVALSILFGGRKTEMYWGRSMSSLKSDLRRAIYEHYDVSRFPGDLFRGEFTSRLDYIDSPSSAMTKSDALRFLSEAHIIGIEGPPGVGKDTIARGFLEREHHFEVMSFADPLRFAASVLFDIPIESFIDREIKETQSALGMTYRRVLQTLGVEVMNAIVPDYVRDRFILRGASYILQEYGYGKPGVTVRKGLNTTMFAPRIAIPDVRMANEQALIFDLNPENRLLQVRGENKAVKDDHVTSRGLPDHPRNTLIQRGNGITEMFSSVSRETGLPYSGPQRKASFM